MIGNASEQIMRTEPVFGQNWSVGRTFTYPFNDIQISIKLRPKASKNTARLKSEFSNYGYELENFMNGGWSNV